jgi:hypothetical protein
MQRAVITTVEEEVFSIFAYIHCWATDVFSKGPIELGPIDRTSPYLRKVGVT